MAASSLHDLLNFEYHFETAAVTFLNSAVGIPVFRTVIEDNLTVPRLEIQLTVMNAMEPIAPRNGGASPNTLDYRAHQGVFIVRTTTDNAQNQAGDHATYLSKARAALLASATNWDNTTLPYYDLKLLRPASQFYQTDGDFNITQIDYDVIFEIRDSAWPD
jgi:hypothetical protein